MNLSEIILSLADSKGLDRPVRKSKILTAEEVREIEAKKKADYENHLICLVFGHIFPNENLDKIVASKRFRTKTRVIENKYLPEDLPFCLYDNTWLLWHLDHIIRAKYDYRIDFHNALRFMEKNPAFSAARHDYEKDLAKAEIKYLVKNQSTSNSNEYTYTNHKLFPQVVFNSLSHLKIDLQSIQEALVETSEIWRKTIMKQTFENQFYHQDTLKKFEKKSKLWWHGLSKLKNAHEAAWSKLQDYEYSEEYEPIIQARYRYNPDMEITEGMNMSPRQAQRTAKKVKCLDTVRKFMLQERVNASQTPDLQQIGR